MVELLKDFAANGARPVSVVLVVAVLTAVVETLKAGVIRTGRFLAGPVPFFLEKLRDGRKLQGLLAPERQAEVAEAIDLDLRCLRLGFRPGASRDLRPGDEQDVAAVLPARDARKDAAAPGRTETRQALLNRVTVEQVLARTMRDLGG